MATVCDVELQPWSAQFEISCQIYAKVDEKHDKYDTKMYPKSQTRQGDKKFIVFARFYDPTNCLGRPHVSDGLKINRKVIAVFFTTTHAREATGLNIVVAEDENDGRTFHKAEPASVMCRPSQQLI